MSRAHLVQPGSKFNLQGFQTRQDGGLTKEEGLAELQKVGVRLGELQELMAVSRIHGLLVVVQGRDTAGKDGAIDRLLQFVNVPSVRVTAFKVPTPEELSHDFLWRVHKPCPGKGDIAIFNRSHYEDVLVVRVHDLVPKSVWSKRYDQINVFEHLLAESNILIAKFCLAISKEEQETRLLAREKDVEKAWKLAVADWREREYWDDYTKAYDEAIERCSTHDAPWHVVPADRKWYRDLCIAETLVELLEPHEQTWRNALAEVGEKAKKELAEYRALHAAG